MTNEEINPVGFLQELCQKQCYRFPQYEEINASGPDHCKEFTFKCKFEGFEAQGRSRQKKHAKSEAAKAMIALIKSMTHYDGLKLKGDTSTPIIAYNDCNNLSEAGSESKNPISVLTEYCQKSSQSPPRFVETSTAGVFIFECSLEDKKTYGEGINKKAAKNEAAFKMCTELKLKCSGLGYFLGEPQVEKDFKTVKNPVSELQELHAKNLSYKNLEYIELPSENNQFVVKCAVDSISCEGRGSTKKTAKSEAARQVLAKLLAETKNPNCPDTTDLSPNQVSNSVSRNVISPSGLRKLEDYNIDSCEEEEDEEKDSKTGDLSAELDDSLNIKLKELSVQSEHEIKDVPNSSSEETNQAHTDKSVTTVHA